MSLWSKFTAMGSRPNKETFPELVECLTWVRFIVGMSFGIFQGVQGAHGGNGVLIGVSVITFIPLMYVENYLRADTDSYSGLTFAGVSNAFSLMILIWILMFTMSHPEEELKLSQVILSNLVDGSGGVTSQAEVPIADEF